MKIRTKAMCAILGGLAIALCGMSPVEAQTRAVPARVTAQVDDTRTVQLKGNVHPLARPEFDRGAVADSQPMTRMLLTLQRSAEQETALQQLMDAQQTKGSASYHAWLTPEQFGKQFGPSDSDVQAVTDWLARQGFQVTKVAAGRNAIEFSGNVAQVRSAFHTDIHKFAVNGKERIANVSDPAIPAALAPVLKGVVALHNFPKEAQLRPVGTFQRNLATRQVKALFTYTDLNGTFYGLGPADFAKIYNMTTPGINGSGQKIAVIGQSNINVQDVCDFRSMFGVTPACPAYSTNNLTVVVNGPDPGILGPNSTTNDELESDLDVEWAGAVAPAAQIVFVTSQSTQSNTNTTQLSQGVDLSALYAVDNNLAPVISDSYGQCEAFLGTAGNAFYNALWQQAAAQGITVAVASGDSGSAGCDSSASGENAATNGVNVSGLASTPYNVAVGGTDFDQVGKESTFWNPASSNDPITQASAKGYIPEIPWDNSVCAAQFPGMACTPSPNGDDLDAGGGGPSNCVVSTTSSNGIITCTTNNSSFPNGGYPKPSWQASLTPADKVRDVPDVSFFASNGFNLSFYVVCQSDANANSAPCDLSTSPTSGTHNFEGIGGTSGSTPVFAAVMALVNQSTGQRQGNANYVLYGLGKNEAFASCNSSTSPTGCVFYDVAKGNNSVACAAGSPNCSNQGASGFGVLTFTQDNGNPAFQAVQGYDLATGLGTINVANLLANWSSAVTNTTPSTGSLKLNNGITLVTVGHGQSVNATFAVLPATAAGTVTLYANPASGQVAVGSHAISGGAASFSTNLLPGGNYNVTAYYSGDTINAPSTSNVVPVTVSSEASKTIVSYVGFDANGNPLTPSTSAQTIPYGSGYILRVDVTNSSGNSTCPTSTVTFATPCPRGSIALSDNGNALNDFTNGQTHVATNIANLNNQGFAEDEPVQLGVGSHILTAVYTPLTGDSSFASSNSTATPLSITVQKATTTVSLASTITPPIVSGTSVTFIATINTTSGGVGPSGTVQFSNGNTKLGSGVTCQPTDAVITPPFVTASAFCTAQITTTISALYPPSKDPRPTVPLIPVLIALLSIVLFALGWRWMPEKRRGAYAYAGFLAFALFAVSIAGCGGGGGGHSVTINAAYSGDGNYTSSTASAGVAVR